MVSTTTAVSENGVGDNAPPSLPEGDYRLVGFDLDLTGRRLIDEICHIAAYTPSSQFSQYVMPFKDLNLVSKRRHMLRVVTVGRYRMLKSSKTGKVLKTKSEISAVTDFVQWLEDLKTDGIILVTHEPRKAVAPFLIENLRKHNLYERFTKIVKGFANSFLLAEQKCAQTVKSYNLFTLGRVLLDKDEELDSAADRARLSYEIVQHLCAGEDDKGSGDASVTVTEPNTSAMSEAVRHVANSIKDEEEELNALKDLLERQNSLRPIFGDKISSRYRYERYRASNLRRLVAEANLTYQALEEAYQNNKKDGLTELVNEKIKTAKKPEDLEELTEMLLAHFDPEYKPKRVERRPVRNSEKSQANEETETGDESGDKNKTGEDKSKTSSTKSSPGKFASANSSPAKGVVDTSR